VDKIEWKEHTGNPITTAFMCGVAITLLINLFAFLVNVLYYALTNGTDIKEPFWVFVSALTLLMIVIYSIVLVFIEFLKIRKQEIQKGALDK